MPSLSAALKKAGKGITHPAVIHLGGRGKIPRGLALLIDCGLVAANRAELNRELVRDLLRSQSVGECAQHITAARGESIINQLAACVLGNRECGVLGCHRRPCVRVWGDP